MDELFNPSMVDWLSRAPTQATNYEVEAPHYDLLYSDDTSDFSYWRNIGPGSGVLVEIGSGSGRLTGLFVDQGYDVKGVEPCEPLIVIAEERFADVGGVCFSRGSAQDIPVPDGVAQVVVAPSSVFSFLLSPQDQLAAAKEASRVLVPDGEFHFSVNYYPHGNLHASGRLFQHWFAERTGSDGTRVYFGGESRLDPEWNVCRYTETIDSISPDGRISRDLVNLDSHLYTPFEILWLLLAAGFTSVGVYGDYERGRVTATSRTLVGFGRKPG